MNYLRKSLILFLLQETAVRFSFGMSMAQLTVPNVNVFQKEILTECIKFSTINECEIFPL